MSKSPALRTTIEIAREAGNLLLQYFGGPLTRTVKSHKDDFATEADHASEALIIKRLQAAFPADSILAEESGMHEQIGSEYTWIVDPLDGTYNFAHAISDFGPMIVRTNGPNIVLAVILNPVKELLATAETESGTELNGVQVLTPEVHDVADIRPFIGRIKTSPGVGSVEKLHRHFHDQGVNTETRRSAAANTLALLAGEANVYAINDMYPWDFAPAAFLLQHAGFQVTDFHGLPVHWQMPLGHLLAAPAGVHAHMLSLLH